MSKSSYFFIGLLIVASVVLPRFASALGESVRDAQMNSMSRADAAMNMR